MVKYRDVNKKGWIIINNYNDTIQEHKNKIIENIEYGKNSGVKKISAIFAIADDNKDLIEKDLINWLILEGYKVSLIKMKWKY